MLCFRKREVEGRALIYRSLAPDLPAMAVDDALNGSQPYSGAFKLFRQIQTLKDAEQLVCVLHVKACAVVPNEHLELIFIAVHAANLDFRRPSHACKFYRVGDKVDHDQPQHGAVSVTDRKSAPPPSNVPTLRIPPDFGNDLLDQLLQVHLHVPGLGPADPGKCQQVVDQVAHSFCRIEDRSYEPLTLLVEQGRCLSLQQLRVPGHMTKWRP